MKLVEFFTGEQVAQFAAEGKMMSMGDIIMFGINQGADFIATSQKEIPYLPEDVLAVDINLDARGALVSKGDFALVLIKKITKQRQHRDVQQTVFNFIGHLENAVLEKVKTFTKGYNKLKNVRHHHNDLMMMHENEEYKICGYSSNFHPGPDILVFTMYLDLTTTNEQVQKYFAKVSEKDGKPIKPVKNLKQVFGQFDEQVLKTSIVNTVLEVIKCQLK